MRGKYYVLSEGGKGEGNSEFLGQDGEKAKV